MLYIIFLIACAFCFLAGWIIAHETVAKECKNFGKFYVGKEMFHCNKIESREKKEFSSTEEVANICQEP